MGYTGDENLAADDLKEYEVRANGPLPHSSDSDACDRRTR
jgi:hypothetical protein